MLRSWIASTRKMKNKTACPTPLRWPRQHLKMSSSFLDATKGTAKMIACNFEITCPLWMACVGILSLHHWSKCIKVNMMNETIRPWAPDHVFRQILCLNSSYSYFDCWRLEAWQLEARTVLNIATLAQGLWWKCGLCKPKSGTMPLRSSWMWFGQGAPSGPKGAPRGVPDGRRSCEKLL